MTVKDELNVVFDNELDHGLCIQRDTVPCVPFRLFAEDYWHQMISIPPSSTTNGARLRPPT